MPRYDFGYLLERIRSLGSKEEMRIFMENLRKLHLKELSGEEFKEIYKS